MLTFLLIVLAALIIAVSVAAGVLLYVYIKISQTTQDEDMDNKSEDTV